MRKIFIFSVILSNVFFLMPVPVAIPVPVPVWIPVSAVFVAAVVVVVSVVVPISVSVPVPVVAEETAENACCRTNLSDHILFFKRTI